MSDMNQEQSKVNPTTGTTDPEGSSEWGFDQDRDPLNRDEAQAEASQYGRYGYQDQAGDSYIKGEPSDPTSPPPDAKDAPSADEDPTIQRAADVGTGAPNQYGSNVDQPMEEPQRSASRSPLPEE